MIIGTSYFKVNKSFSATKRRTLYIPWDLGFTRISHLLDVERGYGLERLGPSRTHSDGGVALEVGEVAAGAEEGVWFSSIKSSVV